MDKFLDAAEARERLLYELSVMTGFKYLKSGMLKKNLKDLVFEVDFQSSHWNLSGQSIEICAVFRLAYKKFGKLPPNTYNIVASKGYHPEGGYWYEITTESKLNETKNILAQLLKETAVDLADRFEKNYEEAMNYLFYDAFDKYKVYLDFVADYFGQDFIKEKAQKIYDELSDDEKDMIVQYKNGTLTKKAFLLNRCNLKYIVDNDLYEVKY